MMRIQRSRVWGAVGVVAVLCSAGCTPRDSPVGEDGRAHGEQMLRRMSERLESAQALSVTTSEAIARVGRDGQRRVDRLTRHTVLRRPDRLYFKVTGDRDLEGYYEGARLTLVAHKEKVFGEIETPTTLDETVDFLSERYDIALPLGDLLTSNAHEALMSTQTTGGYSGEEFVGGTACARFEWTHPNVDWSIWIPTTGEPLPRKLHIVYKKRRGQPDATVEFADWNLAAAVTNSTFARVVPDTYEGIAVIQRASAVLDAGPP